MGKYKIYEGYVPIDTRNELELALAFARFASSKTSQVIIVSADGLCVARYRNGETICEHIMRERKL